MPEHIAIGCNIAAGLLVLAAFVVYNLKGGKINTGTWIILVFGDSLDLASYFEMTEQWWKSIVPATFAIGSILTFMVGCTRKRFSWPDALDWCVVLADILIIGTWSWCERNGVPLNVAGLHEFAPPAAANLALQATAVTAFIPMYRGLLAGRETELPMPWILWSLGFALFCASSLSTFGSIEEIVYPAVGLLTHGLIAVLALGVARPFRT